MSLLDFQRVIARMVTEDRFRESVQSDAASRYVEYDLSAKERDSVGQLRSDRVNRYALMLKHGRVNLALKALPTTHSLLTHEFMNEYVDTFCRAYPPQPSAMSPLLAEFRNMAAYLDQVLDEKTPCPYVADVFLYERVVFELGNDPKVSHSAALFAARNATHDFSDVMLELRPTRGIHIIPLQFDWDVPAIITAVSAGDKVDAVPQRTFMMLSKRAGELAVNINVINRSTYYLLQSCDGTRSVPEIAADVYQQSGGSAGKVKQAGVDKCFAIVHRLIQDYALGATPIHVDGVMEPEQAIVNGSASLKLA